MTTLPHFQEVKEAAITAMATLVASLADEIPAEVPKVRGRGGASEGRAAYRVRLTTLPPPSSLLLMHSRPAPPQMRQTTSQLCPPTLPTLQVLQVLLERLRNEVTRLPAVRGRGAEGGG